jgi:hypothetical protein
MLIHLLHPGEYPGEIVDIDALGHCTVKLDRQEKPVGGVLYYEKRPTVVESQLWQFCFPGSWRNMLEYCKSHRFELQENDGQRCAQVLIYDQDDLQYWADQAQKTGHLMVFDRHIPKNAMGFIDPSHDVYQIFPPEIEERFLYLRDAHRSQAVIGK